jgi:hypothetical protein
MRVDLLSSILSGGKSMARATKDEETGAASIKNQELILFPEVTEADWGTIYGFGIFDTEEPGTGELLLWGRIKNSENVVTGIPAENGKVPLFQENKFNILLK